MNRVPRLWISNTGRCTCDAHGGNYLTDAIASAPRSEHHLTPLDNWLAIRTGEGCSCNECGATVSPVYIAA